MEVMQLPGNSLTVLPLIDKVQLNGEILFGLFRKPRILEAWEQPGNAVHQQLKVKLTKRYCSTLTTRNYMPCP